jgi:hypothetical protein
MTPHNEQGRTVLAAIIAIILSVFAFASAPGCAVTPDQAAKLKADMESQRVALAGEIARLRAEEEAARLRGDVEAEKAARKAAELTTKIKGYVEHGQSVVAVGVDPSGAIQIGPAAQAIGGAVGGSNGVWIGLAGTLAASLAGVFAAHVKGKATGEAKGWDEAKADTVAQKV